MPCSAEISTTGSMPELIELRDARLAALVVGLVDGQHDRQAGLPELLRDRLVAGDQPFASIDKKHQQIGAGNGALSLQDDQFVQRILAGAVKSARVSELERHPSPRCRKRQRIARRPGNRRDDRASRANDAVEEGRLPDVRASDQHD